MCIYILRFDFDFLMQKISLETDLHETVSMSLADSLRVLLEHGLIDGGKPVSFTGGCFPTWRSWGSGRGLKPKDKETAAWRVFKYYYDIKVSLCVCVHLHGCMYSPFFISSQKGNDFSNRPNQMLSSSFSIPMDSSTSIKKVRTSPFTTHTHIHILSHTWTDSASVHPSSGYRLHPVPSQSIGHQGTLLTLI